jgi:hypothetical protein
VRLRNFLKARHKKEEEKLDWTTLFLSLTVLLLRYADVEWNPRHHLRHSKPVAQFVVDELRHLSH